MTGAIIPTLPQLPTLPRTRGSFASLSPADIPGLHVWYEPNKDATAISGTTSTIPDHSGNGFDMTTAAPVTIVAGPGGKKAAEFPTGVTATAAGVPVDFQAFSMVYIGYYSNIASFWKFLNASGVLAASILNNMPVMYDGSAHAPTNDPNPRGSVEEWGVFSFVASAAETKGFINGRSYTSTPLAVGTASGLTLFQTIGGAETHRFAGLYLFDRAITDDEEEHMRTYALTLSTPEVPSLSDPLMVADGDSLTQGFGTETNSWPRQIPGLAATWNFRNRAQNASLFYSLTDRAVLTVDNLFNASRPQNVMIGLCGTNNLGLLSQTAAQVHAASIAYYQSRVDTGFIVGIIGLPARGDSVQDTAGVNALWRADFAVATGITRVFAANPGITYAHYFFDIGDDARFQTPSDTTYYQGDQLHLTNASQVIIADEYVAPLLLTL